MFQWVPTLPLAGSLGARLCHALRKLNRIQRPMPAHNKAPRAYAREAIAEAEDVIAAARLVMRVPGRTA